MKDRSHLFFPPAETIFAPSFGVAGKALFPVFCLGIAKENILGCYGNSFILEELGRNNSVYIRLNSTSNILADYHKLRSYIGKKISPSYISTRVFTFCSSWSRDCTFCFWQTILTHKKNPLNKHVYLCT